MRDLPLSHRRRVDSGAVTGGFEDGGLASGQGRGLSDVAELSLD